MTHMIEVEAKELEDALTDAIMVIQGVELSYEKKAKAQERIKHLLQKIPESREVKGHKTPLDLNPVI